METISYTVMINGDRITVAIFNESGFVVMNPVILCAKGNTPIESIGNDVHNIKCASDLFLKLSKQTLERNKVKECLREDVITNEFPEPHLN